MLRMSPFGKTAEKNKKLGIGNWELGIRNK